MRITKEGELNIAHCPKGHRIIIPIPFARTKQKIKCQECDKEYETREMK
jgi:hypothetical protein